MSRNTQLFLGYLRQALRIRAVLVHEQRAPAALHVELFAMERYAGANDLHVWNPIGPDRLVWTEGHTVLCLELHFLLEEKLRQLGIRA